MINYIILINRGAKCASKSEINSAEKFVDLQYKVF